MPARTPSIEGVENASSCSPCSPCSDRFVSPDGRKYHHCRHIRYWRDKVMEHPGCLGCLLLLVSMLVSFFVLFSWWYSSRRWAGAFEHALDTAPTVLPPRFEQIGCFALLDGDVGAGAEVTTDYWDYTCVSPARSGSLCRSGLPFYAMAKTGWHVVGWKMCAEFCLLKGFDVSGVVDAVVCRCGASPKNVGIWENAKIDFNRTDLGMQPRSSTVPAQSQMCRIVAAQYMGPLPVPETERDITDLDITYIDSILMGKRVTQVTDAKQPQHGVPIVNLKSASRNDGLLQAITQEWLVNTSFSTELQKTKHKRYRHCFPRQCAAGLPWPIKTTYAWGIPYAFSDSIPESTKNAFRAATLAYHATTCIRFTEVSPSYTKEYKIVLKSDEDGCWTYPVGYPILLQQDTEMNLGWCNSMMEVGNIIHELGHAIGMDHEHKRADRAKYVKIDTSHMSPLWEAQYEANPDAFIGDDKVGFEPYDYGSLMHYPANPEMLTLPIVEGHGAHDSETGQRQMLSALDIEQLREMYMCGEAVENECIDMDDELGAAIKLRGEPAMCHQVTKHCNHAKLGKMIKYFCRKSCNFCPSPPTKVNVKSVTGCTDAHESCSMFRKYCPAETSVGNEQWMSEHCRRTCNTPKYCGTGMHDAPSSSTLSTGRTCVDSFDTGFFNIAGEPQSCANLKDKCHALADGPAVQAKCPGTCEVCASDTEGAYMNQMPDSISLYIDFEIENEGFDLSIESQKAALLDVLRVVGENMWKMSTSEINGVCASSPCYDGRFIVKVPCCVKMVDTCKRHCQHVHDTFKSYTPSSVTTIFANDIAFSGLHVKDVYVETTAATFAYSVFSDSRVVAALACLATGACICCILALTHAHCTQDEHELRCRCVLREQLVSGAVVHVDSEFEA